MFNDFFEVSFVVGGVCGYINNCVFLVMLFFICELVECVFLDGKILCSMLNSWFLFLC